MKTPVIFLIALLTVGPLAGCISGDEPAETASVPPAATSAASPSASAAGVDSAATPPTPEPVVAPFVFDGTLSHYATACVRPQAGSMTCAGTPTGSSTSGGEFPSTPDPVKSFDLELSWTAATPASTNLAVHVFACWTSEETVECEMFAGGNGPSPLALSATGMSVPADATIQFYVYNPATQVPHPAGYAYAETEQAFHLEGTLTTLAITPGV